MNTLPHVIKEFAEEFETTKKFMEVYPEGKNEYQPHEKSMKLMMLATHIVEIFGWPDLMINKDKLDFAAGDYQPTFLETKAELQQKLEEDYKKTLTAFENLKEEELDGRWTINMGEQIIADYSKYEALRHALNQITHHRAQLGVYYRLNDIPLPKSYGPSAEDDSF